VDAAGRILRVISSKPSIPGLNIALTIDRDLQLLAERMLKDKKGAIVAMNPTNGEILAFASKPSFDPNLFIGGMDRKEWERLVTDKDFPLQNRVISGQYSPGSVFKIVVALAGLEEDVIDPEEEILCTGEYTLGRHSYSCWRKGGHGTVNLHRALVESCDVYFYRLGKRLGVDTIAYYARMFGLGKKTGFDLDYEEEGLVPTSQWKLNNRGVPWQPGETIGMSIGQSFLLVTPIQMVRLISAVFNGGVIYQPKVIKWVGKKGQEIHEFTPTQMGQIDAKSENLQIIKDALNGVIQETHGTGVRARVRGITIAGKTGTAQVVKLDTVKDYENEEEIPIQYRDHAWFVALATEDKPQLALAILIENAGQGGGTAAAPLARELIKEYFAKK
jgi:penicillin-binding protein 2